MHEKMIAKYMHPQMYNTFPLVQEVFSPADIWLVSPGYHPLVQVRHRSRRVGDSGSWIRVTSGLMRPERRRGAACTRPSAHTRTPV